MVDVLSLYPNFSTFPPSRLPCQAGSRMLRPVGSSSSPAQGLLLWCRRGGRFIFFPFPAAVDKGASKTFPRPVEKRRYHLLLTCFWAPTASLLETLPDCDLPGCRCICCLQLPRLSPAFPLSQALGSATLLGHHQQPSSPSRAGCSGVPPRCRVFSCSGEAGRAAWCSGSLL